MNLEQSLRELARQDAAAQVPARVGTAVMAAWDRRCERDDAALRRRRRMAWAIGAVAAAGLMAVMLWPSAGPVVTGPVVPTPAYEIGDDARAGSPPRNPAYEPEAYVGRVPGPAVTVSRRPAAPAPSIDAGYLLVPDAAGDGLSLTLMRIRMPRSAFARLVPIDNPEGDGLVDVEVLVGEDGVARSIRRAVAVGWADGN